ncbi:Tellurite resistance protein TerB [Microbulbifer aggregans]|uniref:Tellurite resistance protein TerB n=1 Tax=Microbulbifer aggregans TaxID=1769779 RepID=A0A1C9W383_9GAMM|nr:TerB family tellurite resistance protein [Microbulbifer aggregans]AOS95584.1 Tellurite resistance protein TerB [Microbulbifer aggregans]
MLRQIRKLFEQIGESEDIEKRDASDLRVISAALLAEVATVDHNLDERERETLAAVLQQHYRLEAAEASELVEEALSHREDATSLYEFTQTVNREFDDQNKYLLVRQMWQVALADGTIEPFEEHLIRRVADLIYLPHGLFTRARAEAREMGKLK